MIKAKQLANRLPIELVPKSPSCAQLLSAVTQLKTERNNAIAENDRLKLLADEPMRVIAVRAIREVTGCPDIRGENGKYLVDVLMREVKEYIDV